MNVSFSSFLALSPGHVKEGSKFHYPVEFQLGIVGVSMILKASITCSLCSRGNYMIVMWQSHMLHDLRRKEAEHCLIRRQLGYMLPDLGRKEASRTI